MKKFVLYELSPSAEVIRLIGHAENAAEVKALCHPDIELEVIEKTIAMAEANEGYPFDLPVWENLGFDDPETGRPEQWLSWCARLEYKEVNNHG